MKKEYNFVILDPRPIPAAEETNNAIFAGAAGNGVYGIEVTVPALAARCAENLDPQHSGQNAEMAAIEAALTAELPEDGATLATVRADLDAVGAMAVFGLRAKKFDLAPAMEQINLVAAADKFSRGGYPGPQPLPTRKNPWPAEAAGAESSKPLAAIAAAVMDFKIPLSERVATMEKWLMSGKEPEAYRAQVEKERENLISALENGQIKSGVELDGRVATVESTHRAGTMVGYSLAPVVIALNPEFRLSGGEPHRKFTICQFTGGYVDLKAALSELAELEAGWGGSPTIGGSPQGVRSQLTIDQVVKVVGKHLIKKS